MKVYIALPRMAFEDERCMNMSCTVYEAEPQVAQNTGLLDSRGVPLHSVELREPIGFVRLREGHGG